MSYTNGLDKPSDYFNTVLYTGTGSELSISSLDFSPDWVWVKQRGADASHFLYDSVRGATKSIRSNSTNAEATVSESLKSFDSNGFTLGTSAEPNTSSGTYVGWSWKAGGTASSNTDGSITSSVSANTTAGFSIVSYTGSGANATVGHGLSSAPAMIIIKARENPNAEAQHWIVYHQSLGNTSYIWLSRNIAKGTSALGWNDTSPTSNVFSLGNGWTPNNYSGTNYIAYCFAEKKGYSKFGSYTGNGNNDGTFIYTGFKPAWVMTKNTSHSNNSWHIFDNKRNGFNVDNDVLLANSSIAEVDGTHLDILSNGFKLRNTGTGLNSSGYSYIYMCFASSPFTTSTGIPTNAR